MTEVYGGWSKNKMIYWADEIDTMVSRLNFTGTYDNTHEYDYLDCCVRNDEICVYDGNGHWTTIGPCDNSQTEEEILYRCVSCGAPTIADGTCPYCGTINKKTRKFSR